MLAARREAQRFRRLRAEFEHPVGEPACMDQLTRLRRSIDGLDVGIAGIFLVEPAYGRVKSGGIQRLKILRHANGLISELRYTGKREQNERIAFQFVELAY